MTDSIDKKLQEKHDNLDDLDAMLDEAESSLVQMNEFQDDEDAIDRLLVDAGFDSDEALTHATAQKDVGLHDELDDLLGFDDFGDAFNEPEETQTLVDVDDSAFASSNEFQDDEDALDRLLMEASLKTDDMPMQPTGHDDENGLKALDDFSDFSDFNEPEIDLQDSPQTTAAKEGNEPELAIEDLSALADNVDLSGEIDNVDEPDMLYEDNIAAPALAEIDESDAQDDVGADTERDEFSDFSDFSEPDILPEIEIDEPEPVIESLSEQVDEVGLPDEIDEFFSLSDNFDESDMIPDDEVEVPAPVEAELIASDPEPQTAVEQPLVDEVDDFSGFVDDFNESDMLQDDELESVPAPVEAELIASDPEPQTAVEQPLVDEVDDFSGFVDDFNASDMLQDDELESVPAPVEAELIAADPEPQTAVEQPLVDEVDDFSGFVDDFNESDILQDDELESVPAPVEAELIAADPEPQTAVEQPLVDEVDDFSGFVDDFNASDMLQDDELESVPAPVEAELIAADPDPQTADEQPLVEEIDDFSGFVDDFNASDMLQDDELESVPAPAEAELIAADPEPQTADEQPVVEEIDDFSGFVDDFNASDMLQDDELESVPASAEAELSAADQKPQIAVEESFNDLMNDENGIDSLLMDSDFDTEDVEEQTVGKKDVFGDDMGLSEIDDFFQLDEVSDDFSLETGEGQLVDTEQSIQDEDDFLLPDFDITADMEISDMGGNSDIKEDDLADAFADTDFMNEEGGGQSFDSEAAGLNAGADEAMPESQSKPAAKTVIEEPENVKLSPLEQDDIKKQLEDAESKVKKSRIFSYVALGFGVVAVSAAVALGVMTHGAKSEISKLTEQVSTLEASLAKSVQNNPNEEINAVMNSVAQLNHQVYGFITELKGNSQIPVDLLNSNVSGIVAKQGMVSKALDTLQVKMGWEGKMLLESLVAEPPKVDAVHEPAPAKEVNAHEIAPVKTEHAPIKEDVAHEHVATKEDKIAPTKERAKHEAAPVKKVEAVPVPEIAPAKVKAKPETAPAKPIIPPAAVLKEETVEPSKQSSAGKWGINLVAFKQEWFARSKAAEFARLGVFAEVIPVYEKNTAMYRLRVGGFKSKAEAMSNTNRIKKTLNLGSVWVSDN